MRAENSNRKSRRIFSAGGMAFTPTKWMEQVWKDSSNKETNTGGHRMCLGKEGSIDTTTVSLSIINGIILFNRHTIKLNGIKYVNTW